MGRKPTKWVQLRLPWLCVQCGKPIKQPARVDKLFCSAACRVKSWRLGRAS